MVTGFNYNFSDAEQWENTYVIVDGYIRVNFRQRWKLFISYLMDNSPTTIVVKLRVTEVYCDALLSPSHKLCSYKCITYMHFIQVITCIVTDLSLSIIIHFNFLTKTIFQYKLMMRKLG
jgi:hypothetical protein